MTTSAIRVSIVVEGYNETLEIGSMDQTLTALAAQQFPLAQVEVLLVGSATQAAAWRHVADAPSPFGAIRTIDASGDHYYALKNRGAHESAGPIVVFVDSDVMPESGWLAALVEAIDGGAVATCGPSLFRSKALESSQRLPLLVAAAISWGFIAGTGGRAKGFLSHNLGVRRDAFERLTYRTEFGRTLAGSVLLEDMHRAGIHPEFVPAQRVAHAFTWSWWCSRLHVRFGHEVYLLHRLQVSSVSRWARWLGPLDAVATPVWHVLLDFPQWWRYSGLLGLTLPRRLAGLALVGPLSALARAGEMAGMVATVWSPDRMRQFAAHN